MNKIYHCKCGAEFILCRYHDQRPERHGLCHMCYRKQTRKTLPMLTVVRVGVPLKGFNLNRGLVIVEAEKDDFMMVMEHRLGDGAYLLTAGGWYFWAKPDDIRPVHASAGQYIKSMYTPIPVAEYMLQQIQAELEKDLEARAEGYIPYSPKE